MVRSLDNLTKAQVKKVAKELYMFLTHDGELFTDEIAVEVEDKDIITYNKNDKTYYNTEAVVDFVRGRGFTFYPTIREINGENKVIFRIY